MAIEDECVVQHSAYIADRGGKRRIGELIKMNRVVWGRARDDISEAEVLIRGGNCSLQRDLLNSIEPKRSELVIYRGNERVWEGPVDRCTWESNQVQVVAKDVLNYVMGRPLSRVWDNSYTREAGPTSSPNDDIITDRTTFVTTRLGEIISWELANPFTIVTPQGPQVVPGWEQVDPPANVLPHLVIHHFPNEARTSAKTEQFQMAVGEHLDNMARSAGIDYTAVGRAIHIWDTSRPLGTGRLLTEKDFYGDIKVTAYGADYASVGLAVSHDGTYGAAGKNDPYYGPWAKVFTTYDEDKDDNPSQAELNSQAQRNITGRNPVPVEVRIPDNSTIRLSTGLDISDLVPGTYFPLLAMLNSREVSQMQKLHTVTVTETSEGENVQITLVPASRADENQAE